MSLNVAVANPTANVSVPHGDPVLFTGAQGTANTLAVTFQNAGDTPIAVEAGPPVPEKQSSQVPYATVSIRFGKLIDPAQAAALTVKSPDRQTPWKSLWDSTLSYVCLAPTADFSVKPTQSFTLLIGNWPAFATTTSGQLTVEWNNIGGDSDLLVSPVMVLRPSGDGSRLRDDAVLTLVSPRPVTVGDDPTKMVVRLMNLKAGESLAPDSPPSVPPEFTLILACLSEPSDTTLTTCSSALSMSAVPTGPNAGSWEGSGADAGSTPPSWSLTPKTDTILEAFSAVDFELSPITIPPPAGRTAMYLMYTHVPGYDDGYLPLKLKKNPPPPTITASASPQVIDAAKGWVPVKLSWTVSDPAAAVQVNGGVVQGASETVQVNGTKQFMVTATRRGASPVSAEVWVYDYASFLELHMFTLVVSKTLQYPGASTPVTITITDELTFDGDGTGSYQFAMDIPGPFSMGGFPTLPVKWQLTADTVTLTAPDPQFKFILRIANDTLQWVQPMKFPVDIGTPDPTGLPFKVAPRQTPNP